jgi:hypothetical protein
VSSSVPRAKRQSGGGRSAQTLGIKVTTPSGVSRRIQQCVEHIQKQDWEGALVNLFPALDKTAKKRRPKAGVGERIRAFLEEEEILISAVATGNVFKGIRSDGVSITDALYKFGRTSIAHEGELDPRLQFNERGSLVIGQDKWNLPTGYIIGMSFAVVVAPENSKESVDAKLGFNLFGEQHPLNSLWGQRQKVRAVIAAKFRDPQLFER